MKIRKLYRVKMTPFTKKEDQKYYIKNTLSYLGKIQNYDWKEAQRNAGIFTGQVVFYKTILVKEEKDKLMDIFRQIVKSKTIAEENKGYLKAKRVLKKYEAEVKFLKEQLRKSTRSSKKSSGD
jgi:hypothetical protein